MHHVSNTPDKNSPQSDDAPDTLKTLKKLAQGRKTGKSAKPENDDWIEPLMRGLEAGINKHTTVKLAIKTENSKLSLEIKKKKKAVCMPATGQRHSGSADDSEIYGYP